MNLCERPDISICDNEARQLVATHKLLEASAARRDCNHCFEFLLCSAACKGELEQQCDTTNAWQRCVMELASRQKALLEIICRLPSLTMRALQAAQAASICHDILCRPGSLREPVAQTSLKPTQHSQINRQSSRMEGVCPADGQGQAKAKALTANRGHC